MSLVRAMRQYELRRHCHRLDRGRVGITFATASGRRDDPPGVPCARLANLVLGPKEEATRIASYVPRWGIPLAAHLLESKAWQMYRERQKRYALLIGDREPVVRYKQIPGMGRVKRYIITIADDDRAPLEGAD